MAERVVNKLIYLLLSLKTFYLTSGIKAQCETTFNCALEILLPIYLLIYTEALSISLFH